jgi:hypothetical protein
MADPLKLFLNRHRVKSEEGKKEDAVLTHYSLVGGKFNIPPEQHAEWLRLYADHLQRGREPLFFIELRTPIFRMHFDVDFIQPTVPTLSDIVTLVDLASKTMRRFYPDTSTPDYEKRFKAIVLKSPTMVKGHYDNDGLLTEPIELLKTGFHVIWPFLLVTQNQALTLRESCVVDMVQQLPPRTAPSNSYEDVIDECVLTNNGLRMVGSDKAKTCPLCGGKDKECMVCRPLYGKVAENRVYQPYCFVDEHGCLNESGLSVLSQQEDRYACVRLCSIRCFVTEPTEGYVVPLLAPVKTVDSALKERRRALTVKAKADKGKTAYEEGVKWLSDASEIARESAVFAQTQQFLQGRMGQREWANVMIKRFLFSASKGQYFIKVWGEGSNWCSNVQRLHSSSTIYFVINRVGVSQRCFCKKKNPDVATFCSAYASPPILLCKLLSNVLFEAQEDADAPPPPPLVAPVPSIKPFVPSEVMVNRVKTKYIDLTACLAQLSSVNPALVAKQQLAAQQAAQRLNHAIQQRERAKAAGGGNAAGTLKGGLSGGKKKTVKAVSVTTTPSSVRGASDMVQLDSQRASEQSVMVHAMRAELQQRGIQPPPLKKARKGGKT